MNDSLAVFLVNDKARLIGIRFRSSNQNTFHFKSLDQSIKIGDAVVVPSKYENGHVVVDVVEVDSEPDHDSQFDYKWIICKVDMDAHNAIIEQEKQLVTVVRNVKKREKMRMFREGLLGMSAELRALPIFHIEGEVAKND